MAVVVGACDIKGTVLCKYILRSDNLRFAIWFKYFVRASLFL